MTTSLYELGKQLLREGRLYGGWASRNMCGDTLPGHDDAAVVVQGWAYAGDARAHQAVTVWLALHPHSPEARIIRNAPLSAYRIRDERLPR